MDDAYLPPDPVVVDWVQRAFSFDELRERIRATDLVQREWKFDAVALFYILSLGFAAGSDCSLQAFLEHYVEMADCDELSYASLHDWFKSGFVVLPREILDDIIENLGAGREDLNGRLECFRGVLVTDATIALLYQNTADIYTATGDHQAGLKLHPTEFLSIGLPTRFRTADETTHERSRLPTGEWVTDALILLDLGLYDSWLSDRIGRNDGWSVSRVKSSTNFEIVEGPRTRQDNSTPLEGEPLQAVLEDLQRQEIDIRITLLFEHRRGLGASVIRAFRLVGLRSEEIDEYHPHLTNLTREDYSTSDIAQLYRARWEVGLLFKGLELRFGLDEIKTTGGYIIGALIIMVAVSLMMSRVTVDELRSLEARQREGEAAADADSSASRLFRRRYPLVTERRGRLIQLYLMIELGYELSGLDELPLWALRNLNPHRDRLHEQAERDEFGFNHY